MLVLVQFIWEKYLWKGIFDRLSQFREEDGILFVASDGGNGQCKINGLNLGF